ncbi:hypothetical protein KW801_01110 [Candidatus Saccharibacteria bacterium]|nr:hypothetical protein [Candidatus Saccharibacteria bacterium]
MKYKLMATFMVVLGFFVLAGNAFASSHSSTSVSLYRPFPNGIDSNNPQHALQQVEGRAAWDSSYASTIAQQVGRPSYAASEFRAQGYAPHASIGTTNSGVNGHGTVVPVADHKGSQNVKVFLMINIVSQKTVELMVRCGNPRLKPSVTVVVIPWKPFSKGTVIRFHRKVSKPVSITCPSGQKVSGTLTTVVSGFARASTWGKVQGSLQLKLREKIKLQVKSWVTLHCGPAPPAPPPPPTPPTPPATTFTATATATATASATCPDGTTATASASGSGSATSTVSQQDAQNKAQAVASANAQANANAAVKCGSAPPPTTPPPSVTITSVIDLNDVPEGKNSGPLPITVSASTAGSITIDPGNGAISDCNGGTRQASITFSLAAGNNSLCVIYYAPTDASANQGSITYTAIVTTAGGTAKDVKTDTFLITHPIRT